MLHRKPLPLIVALTLALAACGAPAASPAQGSGAQGARGAAVPAAAQPPTPSPMPIPSPTPTSTPPPTATPAPTATATPPATPPVAAKARQASPPESCPVTRPPNPPFTPPPPYPPVPGSRFWYGTEALWTWLPADGTWQILRDKSFWWRVGYDWRTEQQPRLKVTGRRLDAPAPPFVDSGPATNGYRDDIGAFMLTMVDLATPGCWEITGEYAGTQLSFVVWVTP